MGAGFPGGDHHGDGHEDGCVDISRYSDILYNVTEASICSYVSRRTCVKHKRSACVSVPIKTCRAVAYPDCSNEAFTVRMHNDKVVGKQFVGKQCKEQGFHTLIENHKKAVCEQVTKEHCDSKWIINAAGEKVWAGNENCRDVTYADCNETSETVCAYLEFEECSDIIEPNCFPMCMDDGTCGTMKFRIPYQTYDHRLKCLV